LKEEEAHLSRVTAALSARSPDSAVESWRGYLRQAKLREAEQRARERAVEHMRLRVEEGATKREVAAALGLGVHTLGDWERHYLGGGIRAVRRGRRPMRSSPEDRNDVISVLDYLGPQTGVETLKWLRPGMARGEIRDILRRCREHYLREAGELEAEELEWLRLGAVWAMDHTEAPEPIEGELRAVLSVLDLASGAQLLWEGQVGPRGHLTAEMLRRLFLKHGAPLVLKADNGSAFISQEVIELLGQWGVILLWSPPRTPRYNGSCESGIRWMKSRTEQVARLLGRAGAWKEEDLEVAQKLQNVLPKRPRKGARPRGQVFEASEPIADGERAAFRKTVAEEEARERSARGLSPDCELKRSEQAEVDRETVRRALVAHGILNIRKRRVSLTLKSIFRAKSPGRRTTTRTPARRRSRDTQLGF